MHGLLWWIWVLQFPQPAVEASKPLPDSESFLQEVRKHLHSDRLLLSQYTYLESKLERQLDKDGRVKKIEQEVHEVYPSREQGHNYERLISRDGKPLSVEELDKQDRDHDRKEQEREEKLARENPNQRASRLSREAEGKRKEAEIVDEVFRLYAVRIIGRVLLDGYPAILVDFRPHGGYQPKTREGKILRKLAGRAWFCEQDHQLIRIEAELIENVSFGMGMLARLNKGATVVYQRRRVNDEIWLPAETHYSGSARLLLFKGLRVESTSRYSEYRKFTVDTSVAYPRGAQNGRAVP